MAISDSFGINNTSTNDYGHSFIENETNIVSCYNTLEDTV